MIDAGDVTAREISSATRKKLVVDGQAAADVLAAGHETGDLKRIGAGGIAIESCAFSPLPGTLADFRVLRGVAQFERYPFLRRPGESCPASCQPSTVVPTRSETRDVPDLKMRLTRGRGLH